jgi:hypothetical protein
MDQAVICRPLTTKVRVQSQISPCQICGRKSATGTALYPSMSVLPSLIILPMLRTHLWIHVALARMASGRGFRSSAKQHFFKNRGAWDTRVRLLFIAFKGEKKLKLPPCSLNAVKILYVVCTGWLISLCKILFRLCLRITERPVYARNAQKHIGINEKYTFFVRFYLRQSS